MRNGATAKKLRRERAAMRFYIMPHEMWFQTHLFLNEFRGSLGDIVGYAQYRRVKEIEHKSLFG